MCIFGSMHTDLKRQVIDAEQLIFVHDSRLKSTFVGAGTAEVSRYSGTVTNPSS